MFKVIKLNRSPNDVNNVYGHMMKITDNMQYIEKLHCRKKYIQTSCPYIYHFIQILWKFAKDSKFK